MILFFLAACRSVDTGEALEEWEVFLDDVQATYERDGACPTRAPSYAPGRSSADLGSAVSPGDDDDFLVGIVGAHQATDAIENGERAVTTQLSIDVVREPGAMDCAQYGSDGRYSFLSPGCDDCEAPTFEVDFFTGFVVGGAGPLVGFHPTGGAAARLDHSDTWADTWCGEPGENVRCSYGFVCIDAYEPPEPGPVGAGGWSGAVFAHLDEDLTGTPRSWFTHFTELDCTTGEDAGTVEWDYGDGPVPVYPGDCDGFDNDMDGEIDEGAADLDGSGVADCQEGIPAS